MDGSVYFSQALLICLADIKPNGEETEWQQQVCRKGFHGFDVHTVLFLLSIVFFCVYTFFFWHKLFETPSWVLMGQHSFLHFFFRSNQDQVNISSLLLNRSLVVDVKGILLFVKMILEIIQNYVLTFILKSSWDTCDKESCGRLYLCVLALFQVWKTTRCLCCCMIPQAHKTCVSTSFSYRMVTVRQRD